MLLTATWSRPSTLVQRPDGAFRRKYQVALRVPGEQRELPFHQVVVVALCRTGERPAFITDDIDGVVSRDRSTVTLAVFVDDREAATSGSSA